MLINIIKILILLLVINYFFNRNIEKELFVNKPNKTEQDKLLKELINNRTVLEKLYKKKRDKKNVNFDIENNIDNLDLEDYYKLKSIRSGRKLLFNDIDNYCYYDRLGNYRCDNLNKKDNIKKKQLLGLDLNKNLKELGLNQIELDNLYRNKFEDLILNKMNGKNEGNNKIVAKNTKINFSKNDSNCYYNTLGHLMCINKINETELNKEGSNTNIKEDKIEKDNIIEVQENNEKEGKIKKVKLFFKKNDKIYYKIEGGDIDNFTKDNTLCIITSGYNKNNPEDIIINIHPENNKIFLPLIDENKYEDKIDSYFVNNEENMFDRKIINYFTFYDNGYVIYKKKIIYENTFFDIDVKTAKYYEVTDILGTDKKEKTRYMGKWDKDFGNFKNII
jgi:hypothetical protein